MVGEVNKALSLLEGGYQVAGITISGGQSSLMTEIRFIKDEDIQSIHSEDAEFFLFSRRLEQVEDPFGNYRFVLRDSPLPQRPQPLPNLPDVTTKLRLQIGDVELGDVFTLSFNPSGPGNNKGTAFFIIHAKDNSDFFHCDLRDEVVATHKETKKVVFRGLVKRFNTDEKGDAFLECQDLTLKMEQEKISAEFAHMAVDAMAFIAEFSGINYVMPPEVLNTSEREFTIITPVKSLVIDRPVKVGEVTFYQVHDSKDDEFIRKSNNGLNNIEWNGNVPRAKVAVKSTSFYKASVNGYRKISQAIDAISLRTDISIPKLSLKGETHEIPYHYYRLHSRVRPSPWLYCRANNSDSFVIFNREAVVDNYLSFEREPERYLSFINELLNWLMTKEASTLTQQEKNILQVIHWLRRSIQQGDEKDKLLDLWTALEFLISGTKAKKMFDKELIGQIKQRLSEMDEEINPDQMEILHDTLDNINDAPLMEKVKSFQTKYSITLSDAEMKALAVSRKKRNNVIHGICDELVTESDLHKARHIVEKLLLAKVATMGGLTLEWPK